jgi:hypothetical protein
MAALDVLAQRIVMRGLTRPETTAYFEHHLRLVGYVIRLLATFARYLTGSSPLCAV